jgi:hypothetical protein
LYGGNLKFTKNGLPDYGSKHLSQEEIDILLMDMSTPDDENINSSLNTFDKKYFSKEKRDEIVNDFFPHLKKQEMMIYVWIVVMILITVNRRKRTQVKRKEWIF